MLRKMLSILVIGTCLCYVSGSTTTSINDKLDEMFTMLNRLQELQNIRVFHYLGFNISNPPHVELFDGEVFHRILYRTNDSVVTVEDNGDVRADIYFGSQKITANFAQVDLSSPEYSGPASFTTTKNSFHVGIDAKFDRETLDCSAEVTDFHIVLLEKVRFASAPFEGKDITEHAVKYALPALNEGLFKSEYKTEFEREFQNSFCRRLRAVFSILKSARYYRSASWMSGAIESFRPEDFVVSKSNTM